MANASVLENSYADELRQAKNAPRFASPLDKGDLGDSKEGENNPPYPPLSRGEEPQSLRERVMQARRAMGIKEKAKEKLKKAAAPAKQATSQILQKAWSLAPGTFGLTGLYAIIPN